MTFKNGLLHFLHNQIQPSTRLSELDMSYVLINREKAIQPFHSNIILNSVLFPSVIVLFRIEVLCLGIGYTGYFNPNSSAWYLQTLSISGLPPSTSIGILTNHTWNDKRFNSNITCGRNDI